MLRNVETMNYADIEKGLNALGEKVRTLVSTSPVIGGTKLKLFNSSVFEDLKCRRVSQRVVYNVGQNWRISHRRYGWWDLYH